MTTTSPMCLLSPPAGVDCGIITVEVKDKTKAVAIVNPILFILHLLTRIAGTFPKVFPCKLIYKHYPAAAVNVTVIVCCVVTVVLVGDSNLNQRLRVALAATESPVSLPAKIVAELV